MIDLSGISRRYGTEYALKDITFTVKEGQTMGVLGQNGAGKTTMLNILAGYTSPTSGTVTIGGHDMSACPQDAKRLIGFLPELPPLYDEMTVTGYLRFVCELKEIRKPGIPGHLKEILEATGLTETAGRKIGNLSKGYRQRVGLAQALCGNPRVLILDEPTAGLDPRQTAEFRETLRRLKKSHTILFSSHSLSEIQALCDRVIILHQGTILSNHDMNIIRSPGNVPMYARIAMNPDKLIPALKSLPSVARVTRIASADDSETVTHVILEPAAGQALQRELFTLLCGLQAPILSLAPAENTLEEIFLRSTAS
jgi:ABC-2 type transport system ATP-binding protein